MDVVSLDLRKASGTASQSTLLKNLAAHALDKQTNRSKTPVWMAGPREQRDRG